MEATHRTLCIIHRTSKIIRQVLHTSTSISITWTRRTSCSLPVCVPTVDCAAPQPIQYRLHQHHGHVVVRANGVHGVLPGRGPGSQDPAHGPRRRLDQYVPRPLACTALVPSQPYDTYIHLLVVAARVCTTTYRLDLLILSS